MKIYYISSSVIPSQYANSVHVMKMCEAFADNNHEVSLFARDGSYVDIKNYCVNDFNNYGVQDNFSLYKFRSTNIRRIKHISYIYNVLKKIHSLQSPELLYTRYLFFVYFFLMRYPSSNIPIIYEAHGPASSNINRYILGKLFEAKNFIRLVVISEALKKMYRERFPFLPDDKIVVAHDGANSSTLVSPVTDNINSLGRKNVMRVGYVGSINKGRGIETIYQLSKEFLNVDFHIIGGTEEQAKHFSKKIPPNIYCHGFVPHLKVPAILDMMDILLAPYGNKVYVSGGTDTSKWMSPLKIFEYMASGKAILTSDLPVLREILKNDVDALMVEPGDVAAWVRVLEGLLSDNNKRMILGNNAKEKLLFNYTWRKRAQTVLKGINTY